MKNFLKYNWQILLILILGFILRAYKARLFLDYSHDTDLAGWFVRDVLINHHIRLIGQETSTQGVFIGALYYYLLVPFYYLFRMDPVGGVGLALLLGLFGIWSFYFVFLKVFSKREGVIAALFYATSFVTVLNDRGVVPTTPVFTWTVWFFYSIMLILKSNFKKGFILAGVLVAIIWHINVALVLLTPLIVVAVYFSGKRITFADTKRGIAAFFISSIPFFAFEFRHDFSQVRYVIASFSSNQGSRLDVVSQFKRVIHIATQNATTLLFETPEKYYLLITSTLIFLLIFIAAKKILNPKIASLFVLWQLLYLIFFTFYTKILSEYYLHGMNLVWIAILTLSLSGLLKKNIYVGTVIGILFLAVNFDRLANYHTAANGYVYRRELLEEIKKDSQSRDFPCVSISYITNPGYDRGYRYLTWLAGLKTKQISEKVPVYSIVFPLKAIFPTDKTFGTIGLIYPDYKRYNLNTVKNSCEGEDYNLTESMIGFTP